MFKYYVTQFGGEGGLVERYDAIQGWELAGSRVSRGIQRDMCTTRHWRNYFCYFVTIGSHDPKINEGINQNNDQIPYNRICKIEDKYVIVLIT